MCTCLMLPDRVHAVKGTASKQITDMTPSSVLPLSAIHWQALGLQSDQTTSSECCVHVGSTTYGSAEDSTISWSLPWTDKAERASLTTENQVTLSIAV